MNLYTNVEPFDGFLIRDDIRFEPASTFHYCGCWCNVLPAPSMVFQGAATAMEGYTQQSWDLNDDKLRWEYNLVYGSNDERRLLIILVWWEVLGCLGTSVRQSIPCNAFI